MSRHRRETCAHCADSNSFGLRMTAPLLHECCHPGRTATAVSGRIFFATSVSLDVDGPSGHTFERFNFWPKHRSLTLAARKERYRAATVRESEHFQARMRQSG